MCVRARVTAGRTGIARSGACEVRRHSGGGERTFIFPKATYEPIASASSAQPATNRSCRSGCARSSLVRTNAPRSQPVDVSGPLPRTAQFRSCTAQLPGQGAACPDVVQLAEARGGTTAAQCMRCSRLTRAADASAIRTKMSFRAGRGLHGGEGAVRGERAWRGLMLASSS